MTFASPGLARLAAWVGIPAALVASATVVSAASSAAFSSTTVNPVDNWSSGSVVLADDDRGGALFQVSGLGPGSSGANCIAVTSTGSLASAVRLYATGATATKQFDTVIDVVVQQGTGGGFGSCTGFTPLASGATVFSGTLADLAAHATDFTSGLGTWTPTGTGPESRVFRVQYSVASTAPNTMQGGSATLGFTWEAQNS